MKFRLSLTDTANGCQEEPAKFVQRTILHECNHPHGRQFMVNGHIPARRVLDQHGLVIDFSHPHRGATKPFIR